MAEQYNNISCGVQTKREHIKSLMQGFLISGLGGGCVDTFHALLDLAESIRVQNNFDPSYTPEPQEVEAASDELNVELRQLEAELRERYAEQTQGTEVGAPLDTAKRPFSPIKES